MLITPIRFPFALIDESSKKKPGVNAPGANKNRVPLDSGDDPPLFSGYARIASPLCLQVALGRRSDNVALIYHAWIMGARKKDVFGGGGILE